MLAITDRSDVLPHIVFLITGLGRGGAETQMVRLAIGLKGLGHRVGVISMLSNNEFVDELVDAAIPTVCLGMQRGAWNLKAITSTVSLLREWKPDIVVTFLIHATLLGRLTAGISGVPATVCSIRSEQPGGSFLSMVFRMTNHLDRFITVNSRAAASTLASQRIIPGNDRVRVMPNAIEVDDYAAPARFAAASVRRQLGVEPDEFLWLAVGRLEEPKDYPNLITAFGRVVSQGLPSKLRIAGRGPLLSGLQDLVRSLSLEDKVEFLGFRSDVTSLLHAADALVLSSAWEGMPNAVMEALAAALPVVATRVGGVAELVDENSSGLIVPAQDPEALSSAMIAMMNLSQEQRNQMGEEGKRHVEESYGLQKVLGLWSRLFREVDAG